MFTGIVEGRGRVVRVERRGEGLRIDLVLGPLAAGVRIGDSIAVSGCCLTVVALAGERASFDAVPETLARTWLAGLAPGQEVNLERSLALGQRLDGHLVQGHVDGTAVVRARRAEGGRWGQVRFDFGCAPALLAPMVEKGSVAVDGVSLTLVEVTRDGFAVAIIPHTLAVTTFGRLAEGDRVNIECDVLGKWFLKAMAPYLERLERLDALGPLERPEPLASGPAGPGADKAADRGGATARAEGEPAGRG